MAQKVFPGAIVHHFSIFDTSRLWEKGRLCFLYTSYTLADEHWTPPSPGGMIPSNTKGISYEHWVIPDFKGKSQSPLS
ncbi:MAG: hypothetical protein GY807_08190 [Gammaproteobacteria bacterium]|nr:hypothetical protein [Gammaproteobacteria bacterium]